MAQLQVNFFSKSLLRTVTVNAIVPVDKFVFPEQPVREKKPFKTLYLLHGIFGNYTDWIAGTRIQSWAEAHNLAVIMPSGDNHFYVDNENSGQMYSEFIGRELVEFTRDLLPLSRRREDTFIAGLSMGGFGAIRNGLKYHDVFGALAGLSSALVLDGAVNSKYEDPSPIGRRGYFEYVFGDLTKLLGSDRDPRGLIKLLKESGAEFPKIYLCCGTEDFLIGANRDYHQFLLDNGVEHSYIEGPGVHNWEFWDEYIRKVLDWLPLEDSEQGIGSGNVSK
jgi:S-formylglutathione hydrolase FrmB